LSRTVLFLAIVILIASTANAQQSPAKSPSQSEQSQPQEPAHDPQHEGMPGMQHQAQAQDHPHPVHKDPSLEQAQFASGTSWQSSSTPEHMWMTNLGHSWGLMVHGNAFLTYNQQPRPVSAGKVESQNWIMLMEQQQVSAATVTFREMLSAEPFTTPEPGFGEVFQTGETFHGAPLVNYQHPHDLFSELSALFTLASRISYLLYLAPVGEPALGPTAFPHRLSAMENPAAPLSHHLQDSTHVSFGVVSTGVIIGPMKVEGSIFNGREPDEHRYNFDFGTLDSFSGRISVAPTQNLTAQYSFGHLRKPEALEPGDINRQTASIAYNRPLTTGNWTTTLIWGRNDKTALGRTENSYLLESSLNFATKNYAFTRLELVDKDELEIPFSIAPPAASFRIGGFTFGGVRDLIHNSTGQVGLGAALTFYSKPQVLDAVYGRHPVAFQVFLRLRPGLMKMNHF
jgi:hypothetical protein